MFDELWGDLGTAVERTIEPEDDAFTSAVIARVWRQPVSQGGAHRMEPCPGEEPSMIVQLTVNRARVLLEVPDHWTLLARCEMWGA